MTPLGRPGTTVLLGKENPMPDTPYETVFLTGNRLFLLRIESQGQLFIEEIESCLF